MGGFGVFQCLRDHLNYRIYIGKHRVVPKAEHLESKVREVIISMDNLRCLLGVLAALYFYNEAPLQANEINDKGAYRPLATEIESAYLSHAETRPELALCVRKVAPGSARLSGGHSPILTFPRTGGRDSSLS